MVTPPPSRGRTMARRTSLTTSRMWLGLTATTVVLIFQFVWVGLCVYAPSVTVLETSAHDATELFRAFTASDDRTINSKMGDLSGPSSEEDEETGASTPIPDDIALNDADLSDGAVAPHKKRKYANGEWRRTHWDPAREKLGKAEDIKVTRPVFIASLPKSGTTSVWQYFQCGGWTASHQWVKYNETKQIRSGECMALNIRAGRPPFEGCGDFDVWTDTGFCKMRKPEDDTPFCYYPSVDGLDAMYEHYPNMTIVQVVRNRSGWYDSMAKWGKGSLLKRWRRCNATGFPGYDSSREALENFYDWHTAHVRDFSLARPSINYIEVSLEDLEAGNILQEKTGIPSACWGDCSPDSKFCKRIGDRR